MEKIIVLNEVSKTKYFLSYRVYPVTVQHSLLSGLLKP